MSRMFNRDLIHPHSQPFHGLGLASLLFVCVCVRERERERESIMLDDEGLLLHSLFFLQIWFVAHK